MPANSCMIVDMEHNLQAPVSPSVKQAMCLTSMAACWATSLPGAPSHSLPHSL